jgi:hypothetical protein
MEVKVRRENLPLSKHHYAEVFALIFVNFKLLINGGEF